MVLGFPPVPDEGFRTVLLCLALQMLLILMVGLCYEIVVLVLFEIFGTSVWT